METTNKGIFDDFKSAPLKVVGSSTINHAVRVRLAITADEYCFMLYLETRKRYQKQFDLGHCYMTIGYSEDICKVLYDSLVNHGFLGPFTPGMIPVLTKRWEEAFNVDFEFEKFWFETLADGKKRAAWPGSKEKAKKLFENARKEVSLEYLIKQRDHYFIMLAMIKKYRNFDRARMIATRWLGPDKEFNNDWKGEVEKLNEQYKPHKPLAEAVTMDTVKDAFNK